MPDDTPVESPRRLNLLDLALVVAGSAVGFSMARYFVENTENASFAFRSRRVEVAQGWLTSMGLALTMTLLVMRLRRPRPLWVEIRRQPVFIACLIVALSVALMLPQNLLYLWGPAFGMLRVRALFARLMLNGSCYGQSVLLAWVILRVSGGWRSEPALIDKLGRAIGWFWMVLFVATPIVLFFGF